MPGSVPFARPCTYATGHFLQAHGGTCYSNGSFLLSKSQHLWAECQENQDAPIMQEMSCTQQTGRLTANVIPSTFEKPCTM